MKWHLTHKVHGTQPWAVQAEALKRAHHKNKYGFWLEQGLGKTSLALNEYIQLLNDDVVDLMVVIAPNSFKLDWVLAPAEWGVPYIASGLWPRDSLPEAARGYLYAVNYEAVSRPTHKEVFQTFFEQFRVLLIIDESSKIANPSSDITKAVIELAKRATFVRELNGTPMTQSVMDYYGQLRCLGELNGVKSTAFRARYADMGGYMGKKVTGIREENKEELYALLERCAFRALKSDWRKDLPPQLDVPVHLEMTPRQQGHYREMMEDFYTEVVDVEVTAELVLTKLERLRQISSCLAMDGDKHRWIEPAPANPKVRAVEDLIEACPGKMIVVYTYRPTGDMLLKRFTDLKLEPAMIRGQMKLEWIITEKERFNHDPDCRVLVAQQQAACMGHTLLGQKGRDRCASMCFFENSFSLRDRLQMRDRNHRGEQDEPCSYYDLITSPMEQIVVDALSSKKEQADTVDAAVKVVREGWWRI
jgi:SNF2 family DNA or RNA helicase